MDTIDISAYCWTVKRLGPRRIRLVIYCVPGLEKHLVAWLKRPPRHILRLEVPARGTVRCVDTRSVCQLICLLSDSAPQREMAADVLRLYPTAWSLRSAPFLEQILDNIINWTYHPEEVS